MRTICLKTIVLTFAVCLLIVHVQPNAVARSRVRWDKWQRDMQLIKNALQLYEQDAVVRLDPATEPRWCEILIEGGYIEPYYSTFFRYYDEDDVKDGSPRVPCDVYGTPYYVAWTADGELTVASLGRNCTYDSGKLDDWVLGEGPNFGYWYKKHWPRALVYFVIGLIIVGFISRIRFMRSRKGVFGLITCFAIVVLTACSTADLRGPHDGLMSCAGALSGLTIFISFLWYGIMVPLVYLFGSGEEESQDMMQTNQCCIECGYDLQGLNQPGCPECGNGRVNGCPSLIHQ